VRFYFHPQAEAEYLEAALWYEQQAKELGLRFIEAVRTRLTSIAEHPEHYSQKHGKFREVLVDDTFPYLIVFVLDAPDELFVSSIFHTSRNPKGKYRRPK
jgi:plasmid stabilization system protein ParE